MSKNTKKRCIYLIKAGRQIIYVGLTVDLERRKKEHLRAAKNGAEGKLYDRMRKLLKRNPKREFKFIPVEEGLTLKEANAKERQYIRNYRKQGVKLANVSPGGAWWPKHKRKKKRRYRRKH